MKLYLTIIILVFVFISCKEEKTSLPNVKAVETTLSTTDSVINIIEDTVTIDLSSKLRNKVTRLSKLEHNYVIKDFVEIDFESSMLIGQLERLSRRTYLTDMFKDVSIEVLKKELYAAKECFVKGTKAMKPGSKTYPRARLVEYIYNTEEAAKQSYEALKEIKTKGSIWMLISKSPDILFLEDNRIYFVRTGGMYMLDIYKDIEVELKLK